MEAELVEAFAARHGVRVDWRIDSEATLFEALTKFELGIVAGGITQETPWAPELGLPRPYVRVARRTATGARLHR